MGILSWLQDDGAVDRSPRYPGDGMAANYWGGGTPQPHPIKNMSLTGAFISDTDLWEIGTVIAATFKTPEEWGKDAGTVLRISFQVVRHTPEGMGVRFLPAKERETRDCLGKMMSQLAERAGQPIPKPQRHGLTWLLRPVKR